jgi:hypothetical protein
MNDFGLQAGKGEGDEEPVGGEGELRFPGDEPNEVMGEVNYVGGSEMKFPSNFEKVESAGGTN